MANHLWLVVSLPKRRGLSHSQLGLLHFDSGRAASGASFVGKQAHISPRDWNELVKCGKNRVLIILSFLRLDW